MTSLPDRTTTTPIDQLRIDRDLERALRTLSFAMDASATTQEPVVLRSIEVAMFLRDLGYGRDVQVAGLLHDLLKYTMYPLHDIAHDFGDEVSVLIMANTLDPSIEDATEQYEEAFPRCLAWGRSAAVVMAVALLQETVGMDGRGLAKVRHFLELSKSVIGDEPVWLKLEARAGVVSRAQFPSGGRL
jgi:(p)ppGpp synthase/HD superfamily hydrolase